jgi:hypothetical protein
MTNADQLVEDAAGRLQQLANRMAGAGGLKSKLAQPLAEDADLIRKMKPSLIKARAKGQAPRVASSGPQVTPRPKPKQRGAGPNPWLVAGVALAAGIFVAKWIDWRGHAHPRD